MRVLGTQDGDPRAHLPGPGQHALQVLAEDAEGPQASSQALPAPQQPLELPAQAGGLGILLRRPRPLAVLPLPPRRRSLRCGDGVSGVPTACLAAAPRLGTLKKALNLRAMSRSSSSRRPSRCRRCSRRSIRCRNSCGTTGRWDPGPQPPGRGQRGGLGAALTSRWLCSARSTSATSCLFSSKRVEGSRAAGPHAGTVTPWVAGSSPCLRGESTGSSTVAWLGPSPTGPPPAAGQMSQMGCRQRRRAGA